MLLHVTAVDHKTASHSNCTDLQVLGCGKILGKQVSAVILVIWMKMLLYISDLLHTCVSTAHVHVKNERISFIAIAPTEGCTIPAKPCSGASIVRASKLCLKDSHGAEGRSRVQEHRL